jgi:hypothetical protein
MHQPRLLGLERCIRPLIAVSMAAFCKIAGRCSVEGSLEGIGKECKSEGAEW